MTIWLRIAPSAFSDANLLAIYREHFRSYVPEADKLEVEFVSGKPRRPRRADRPAKRTDKGTHPITRTKR